MAAKQEAAGAEKPELSGEIKPEVSSGKRYSIEECQEIGKSMLEALKMNIKQPENTYIPAILEPHAKAWRYLEERHVLRMLEILLTKLVYEQPDAPLEYMIQEIEKLRGIDLAKTQPFDA